MTTTSNAPVSESSPPPPNAPRPDDPIAVQIVTLLDFTGPLAPVRIAWALEASYDAVYALISRLLVAHYVRFSAAGLGLYESTYAFDPDRDGELGGYPTGPHTPKRRYGDGPA